MLLLLLAFGLYSLRKGVFVQFTADVLVVDISFFFFFFFFLGGKDIHYTSAMIATSRVCDVHHKPERPKLTTHLEFVQA